MTDATDDNSLPIKRNYAGQPDWADKMAELVYGDWVLGGNFCTPVAIALRKAKADGRKEVLQELGLRPGDSVTYGPTDHQYPPQPKP